MKRLSFGALFASLGIATSVQAQSMAELCGAAPRGLLISETANETIRRDLSNDINGIGLVEAMQLQREQLYQSFNDPDRTFVDAYLAFVTCTLLHNSDGLSVVEKIDQVTRVRLEINGASNRDATRTDVGFSLAGFRGSVFGYNVDQESFQGAKSLMEDLGLNFSGYRSYLSQEALGWFAEQSTVFYYVEENRGLAERLVERLEQQTGLQFVASRGAGKAVYEGQEAYTFFIHVIN